MTALPTFRENLFLETSDHEQSILLVDIMNAIGFSETEREIERHNVHLQNEIVNIFLTTDKFAIKQTGSTSEGMCGGNYGHRSYHDSDLLFKAISSYTLHVQTILTTIHCYTEMTLKIMMHLFLSQKRTTFQDMSNYHWRK